MYDGPHDPAFLRALLRLLADEGEAWSGEGAAFGRARAVRPPGGWASDPRGARQGARRGAVEHVRDRRPGGERPVIVKLFRVLAGGENPDVVVQTALAAAGSSRVARPAGWIEGWWPDPEGKTPAHGHLAYACEFLPGSRDAWREATEAIAAGAPSRSRPAASAPRPPRCTPPSPGRCRPGRSTAPPSTPWLTGCSPGSTGP